MKPRGRDDLWMQYRGRSCGRLQDANAVVIRRSVTKFKFALVRGHIRFNCRSNRCTITR